MLGWLWKLLGLQRRGREWSEFDRQFAEMLELRKKKIKLDMLESSGASRGGSKGISSLRDDIQNIKDIAGEMGWIGESEAEDESLEKQLTKTVLAKMMGGQNIDSQEPTAEKIVEQEGQDELKRVLEAVKSGKINKQQFKQLAGAFYDQNKPLNSKKRK